MPASSAARGATARALARRSRNRCWTRRPRLSTTRYLATLQQHQNDFFSSSWPAAAASMGVLSAAALAYQLHNSQQDQPQELQAVVEQQQSATPLVVATSPVAVAMPPTTTEQPQAPTAVSVNAPRRRCRPMPSRRELLPSPQKITYDNNKPQGKVVETLYDAYEVDWDEPVLGRGAYGAVYLARHAKSGTEVALKKLAKRHTDAPAFWREASALHAIQHHNHILSLQDMYEDSENYYMVLELAKGGEVYEDLVQSTHQLHDAKPYTEAQAARLLRQLASALEHLHDHVGLVHADIKCENLLLRHEDADRDRADIVLIDFGCAVPVSQPTTTSNDDDSAVMTNERRGPQLHCSGTAAYWPPERFAMEDGEGDMVVSPSMDMWSVGIILYILLTQTHPFDPEGVATDGELHENICACRAPPQLPKGSSPGAQDVLNGLLAVDPQQRMTAHQLRQHPWVRQQLDQQQHQ